MSERKPEMLMGALLLVFVFDIQTCRDDGSRAEGGGRRCQTCCGD